ncbi:MAG: GAF domain-containing sensor histidine kinase [Candidatus Omnitrophica bacterium]|nr:GAF domain-containing sensor histidine kinase [Candidatus Omnitrophota bacterium]
MKREQGNNVKPRMQGFLQALIGHCLDTVEGDTGSILLFDRAAGNYVVRVARGPDAAAVVGARVGAGEGIAGRVAQSGRPLLVEDIRGHVGFAPRPSTERYRGRSFICMPVDAQGQTAAVINVTGKKDNRPFSQQDMQFLKGVAAALAQTIETAWHAEHVERQLDSFKNSTAVTRFTSAIAHELNNPLDGIIRYVQLSLRQAADGTPLKEYLLEAQSGLRRMAVTLRSMLEFSFAGDRHYSPLERQMVCVSDLLRREVGFWRELGKEHRIELQTDLAADLPLLPDYGLGQVFSNLIKNAFEAMGSDGSLKIASFFRAEQIWIEIADSGPGVADPVQEKIFEPFFSTKHSGTGLGLAIVKEIIDAYQGVISVENSPARGAIFCLRLPVRGA